MSNLHQELLDRLLSAKSEEERALVTILFNINSQPEIIQKLIWRASVLNWFNKEILSEILVDNFSESDFLYFKSLPYVEEFYERGWCIHEKTREILRASLWETDRGLYKSTSLKISVFYRKFYPNNQFYRAEAIYHSLVADEKRSVGIFDDTVSAHINRFQYSQAEAIINPVLDAVLKNRITSRVVKYVYFYKSRLSSMGGQFSEAKTYGEHALSLTEKDDYLRSCCTHILGDVCLKLSDLDGALKYLTQSLRISQYIGEQLLSAHNFFTLGELSNRLCNYPEFLDSLSKSEKLYLKVGNKLGVANCHQSRAHFKMLEGKYADALQLYNSAYNAFSKEGAYISAMSAKSGVVDVHVMLYDPTTALELTKEISLKNSPYLNTLTYANIILTQSNVESMLYDTVAAKTHATEALTLFEAMGEKLGEVNALRELGDISVLEGCFDDAFSAYDQALGISAAHKIHIGALNSRWSKAHLHIEMEQYDLAEVVLRDVISRFSELNMRHSQAKCFQSIGKIAFLQSNHDLALTEYNISSSIFQDSNCCVLMAYNFLMLGDFLNAKVQAERSVLVSPNYFDSHLAMAVIFLFEKNYLASNTYLAKSEELCSNYGEIYIWKAILKWLMGIDWESDANLGLQKINSKIRLKFIFLLMQKFEISNASIDFFHIKKFLFS